MIYFLRFPPTQHWSLRMPTTCSCLKPPPRTPGRVRTSTPSSCHWPAASRPRSPCSTEMLRERTGGSDSRKRLKQRAIVPVEAQQEWEVQRRGRAKMKWWTPRNRRRKWGWSASLKAASRSSATVCVLSKWRIEDRVNIWHVPRTPSLVSFLRVRTEIKEVIY